VFIKIRNIYDTIHLVRRPLIGLLYESRVTDDEYRTFGGMRIGRGNQSTEGETYPSTTFFTNKSHMAWPDLEPGPQGWEAGY
jgi:hypothetical protein